MRGSAPVVEGGETLGSVVAIGGCWGEATLDGSRGLVDVKTEGGGTDVGLSSPTELCITSIDLCRALTIDGDELWGPPRGLDCGGGVLLS